MKLFYHIIRTGVTNLVYQYIPYADESFSVIIASNVLHVISNPENALDEIYRVLKSDGVLIVPIFTHGDSRFAARVKILLMKRAGFPQQHSWTEEEYLTFLTRNIGR